MRIIKIVHLSKIRCWEVTNINGNQYTITVLAKEIALLHNITIEEFIYCEDE